jgi:hypothetical protein
MSLKARLGRVERQLGRLESGGCAACSDWRGPTYHLQRDDVPPPTAERCPTCGRTRPQFVMILEAPPGAKEWLAQLHAEPTIKR